MTGYHYLALVALTLCLVGMAFHFVRLIRAGNPREFARPRGKPASGIAFSFLGAMCPAKKESAFLHLPTYVAGLLYHGGTFVSIILFPPLFLGLTIDAWLQGILTAALLLSGLSGIAILIKRFAVRKLRILSNPDDYLSNLLVTVVQLLTAISVQQGSATPLYFVCVSVLLLYLPLGKLKHSLYFFAARYQLGRFYGWRGVWPLKKRGHVA